MLDPVVLKKFKRLTREDEQIADLLVGAIDCERVRSILDVGAGPGVISRALARATGGEPRIDVIEPQAAFTYPPSVRVIRESWESAILGQEYDLIVMSHVIGHFPPIQRSEFVAHALDCLSRIGVVVVVENAPREPFWSLNVEMGRRQTMQYVIDFDDLERVLHHHGASFKRDEHVLNLYLGSTEVEQLRMLNVFFPWPFSPEDLQVAKGFWTRLNSAGDGILRLAQRFYYIAAAEHASS